MDRPKLQRLALLRRDDTEALLAAGRWTAAYYLIGYAVECGLKACLLKHLGESDAVFGDVKYLGRLAKCWTHDLEELVSLAGLGAAFGTARGANPALDNFWTTVLKWKETSRYEERDEADARALHEAVTNNPDGVLTWLQSRW